MEGRGSVSGAGALDPVCRAMAAGDWQQAVDLLAGEAPELRSAEGLELLAMAAYANGGFEAAVAAWEDLHALLARGDDRAGAARAAAMIAMFLMMDTGLMAPVRGWLRRAERLLEGLGETPAHALIAMTRTYERFMCGDMDAARVQSALAIELGERQGVEPAVVIGRVASARVRIFDGHLDEGLEQLDEIGALLMAGGADPLTTGMMYCELICAAQGLGLHDRAQEWTEVMDRWRHGVAFGGINGRCRVHRAEMLRMSGPCQQAEEEALGACEELRPWMRREFGWPLVELGTIRLRKGDLAGAEEAFVAAHEHAWSPHPGLALLRLEQGDVDAAVWLITEAIEHPFDIPSKERPPFGDLCLAPLLEAQAEIAAAAGDAATACRAAERLRAIADSYPSRSLDAGATLAEARAALAQGDVGGAIKAANAAVMSWAEIGAPFEVAVARIVLGEALARSGNAAGARMEWQTAGTAFASFGAVRWSERAKQLAAPAASTRPDRRRSAALGTAVFRRDGDARLVGMDDVTVTVRDLVGFRYVERMLAEPGREFHVLDLVAVEQGTLPASRPPGHGEAGPGTAGEGLPMLDDEARRAYRRRLAEVEEDIDEAKQMNDLGRIALAERDRDYLIAELARAVGMGGRARTVGGTSERARTSVTRSIRYAIGRLTEHHPVLAGHLEQCVRTGTYCSYTPDPLARVDWDF